MAGRRRRVRGAGNIQRLLRQLPDDAKAGILTEFYRAGPDIVRRMQSKARLRTGALRAGISYRVFPKTVRLIAGLIGTKSGRSKLFYGRIQNFGRKAQITTARRFRAGGQRIYFRGKKFGPSTQTYAIRVPFMKGTKFVTGSMPDLRRMLQANLKTLWKRALGRIRTNGLD